MKKFKVIGVPWHIGHQYELAKLSFIEEYDILINPYRKWSHDGRPMPDKMKIVPYYEPGKYDFAILHVDQQAIYDPDGCGERISKGRLYNEVNELIQDIPKIVINHMTPFHDRIESTDLIEIIKGMVGDNFMITNSNEAAKQWGWGHPVIHGMDVDEWWDLPKEPRCGLVLSAAGMEKAYRRTFGRQVVRRLKEKGVPVLWVGDDTSCASFDEYRKFLGSSLVFFMPTWQSPRPRARTEAMLSGCCVVTTPYHDADTFIKDGVNGFLTSKHAIKDPRIIDNPDYSADLIYRLVIEEPELALRVGQEGKKTARKLFTQQKFEDQWIEVLKKVGVWH